MGRRNWCQVDWDSGTGELVFDIRVEKEKGGGQTVGCVMLLSETLSIQFVFPDRELVYFVQVYCSYTTPWMDSGRITRVKYQRRKT